ncbi:superoxide dismutase [Roseomonas sp. CCTCC AB2023176]|uniref:superoxide dismutase n=1 Tax=Roseomonas sp. CCTCC AB2023176 TaxID=3342640 RepID=UPI0035DCA477
MTPTPTRRAALGAGAALAALAFAEPRRAAAQGAAAPAQQGPFALPPLGYAYNAMEPHIDAQTMELHHTRHHQAFITNLNAAAREYPQIGTMPVPDLLSKMGELPEAVRATIRNSGGGHANHTMFWEVMNGRGGTPSGEVATAIQNDLGGFDKMKTDFNAAGARVFGSGWVFVTVGRDGKLAIATRPNQDNPLFDGTRVLFGNDVWEHAYYLKYQNRRPEYLANWWNVVNWEKVGQRYAAAKAGTLGV